MKLKIAILAIVLSTVGLIGVINIIVNKVSAFEVPAKGAPVAKDASPAMINGKAHEARADGADIHQEEYEPEEDESERMPEASVPKSGGQNDNKLSDRDEQLIKAVASLSDKELGLELETLSKRIEDEEIFEKLDEGEYTPAEAIKAKEVLEKFGLLGLEKNRRKFVAIDPDLKDALYAHRDSLKEIREVLNEE